MSDERNPEHYDQLKKTHERVAEEDERQRAAEAEKEANSPEARLAAMEAELAEKVRLGRITKSEMNYQLTRFDNKLVTEMNAEDAQQRRDKDAAARGTPEADAKKSDDRHSRTSTEREAEAREHEFASRGEISEARSTRPARLRNITEELARDHQEREGDGSDLERDAGDHSR